MNRAEAEKQFAEIERQIADARAMMSRQPAMLSWGLAGGFSTEGTLYALESSLRTFEEHRERILSRLMHQASPQAAAVDAKGPGQRRCLHEDRRRTV
jgi:hypothetical protein